MPTLKDLLKGGYHTNVGSVTGNGLSAPATARRVTFPFENYEIVLAVTDDGRVLGVVEVRLKKDFRSVQQRIASSGVLDLEKYYRE